MFGFEHMRVKFLRRLKFTALGILVCEHIKNLHVLLQ